MHSVDLEEFKYGGTNITAFRLVDPEKPEVQHAVKEWSQGEARHGRKLDIDASKVKVGFFEFSAESRPRDRLLTVFAWMKGAGSNISANEVHFLKDQVG